VNQKPEVATSQNEPIVSAPRNDNMGTFEYELIGGHLRLLAAQKLGWETLNALVLEVPPAQAILAALMDNQGEDMHWLDWYLAIELTATSDPNLTQKAIAESIEVTESYVSQALKVLKLFNQSSRDQILQQLKISDP